MEEEPIGDDLEHTLAREYGQKEELDKLLFASERHTIE